MHHIDVKPHIQYKLSAGMIGLLLIITLLALWLWPVLIILGHGLIMLLCTLSDFLLPRDIKTGGLQ